MVVSVEMEVLFIYKYSGYLSGELKYLNNLPVLRRQTENSWLSPVILLLLSSPLWQILLHIYDLMT